MSKENKEYTSCLRDEIIIVRRIPKVHMNITDPKHVFHGGMAENGTKRYTVPLSTSTRTYVEVLTLQEEKYLEVAMGLPELSLSRYKIKDNFWSNYIVRLGKSETRLNLNDPSDYIKYKVLLANVDFIAASLDMMKRIPKTTYEYVLVTENAEIEQVTKTMTSTQEAWKNYGKIENDPELMLYVAEVLVGKKFSKKVKPGIITTELQRILNGNPELFNNIINDPHLRAKMLIYKAVEASIIVVKGDYYYYGNSALCNDNETPVIENAAKYLDHPKQQTLRLSIEAKLTAE